MSLPELLAEAGLTGRGGAAFSTAVKVRAAAENDAALIVNACDGELGATKDAWVVEHHLPSLVAGVALVVCGRPAEVRYAAHRGSATESGLRAAGLPVLPVPARYVSSEESALISLARGGLARPMVKRQPFVLGGRDQAGRRVAPTVVLNAETVWRVQQVVERGPAWFRSHGTADEPGPRLVTVTGHVRSPGVVQAAAGVPLRDLLAAAGGPASPDATVLVGGLGGTFLSSVEAATARWSRASLASYGGAPGAGVVEVLDPARCPLDHVDRVLSYAAGETAGQCGPCMFGVPTLAVEWRRLAAAPTREGWAALHARVDLLAGRGACRFPDGVAGFVRSALRVHAAHLEQHVDGSCDRRLPDARTA